MTNLDYIRGLDAENLVDVMFDVMIPVGKEYANSRAGIVEWLNTKCCSDVHRKGIANGVVPFGYTIEED